MHCGAVHSLALTNVVAHVHAKQHSATVMCALLVAATFVLNQRTTLTVLARREATSSDSGTTT
eukprot:7129-Heterococcus_DN1.PRE.3